MRATRLVVPPTLMSWTSATAAATLLSTASSNKGVSLWAVWVSSVSGFSHPFVFFGVFPCVWVFPTPSYHMLCNYHTSFRVTPTTHSLERSLAPPRRSLTPPRRSLTPPRLASPTREATNHGHHVDLDDDQHPTHTLEHPKSPPQHHKSRQPTGNPDDLDDPDDRQHTYPHPRTLKSRQPAGKPDDLDDRDDGQQARPHP